MLADPKASELTIQLCSDSYGMGQAHKSQSEDSVHAEQVSSLPTTARELQPESGTREDVVDFLEQNTCNSTHFRII